MELHTGSSVAGGRYTVEGLLGQGGMAVVYKIQHAHLRAPLALKVMQNPSQSQRERLIREGRVQASLRHPNVVSVLDVIEVRGAPALVIDFIDGPDLDRVLKSERLSTEQVDALGREILAGVAEAHRLDLIHRDLKPGNVMLDLSAKEPVARVADFGLVKRLGSAIDRTSSTRTGAVMGTPAYMAPEQIRDATRVDKRADVFALGAILYELLCGQRAFGGKDSFDVFEAIIYGRYRAIRDRAPDAPERMLEAIEWALRPERDERPSSAAELLEAWADGTEPPKQVWPPAMVETLRTLTPPLRTLDSSPSATLASWSDPAPDAISAEPGTEPARSPTPSNDGTTIGVASALSGLGAGAALLIPWFAAPAPYVDDWYSLPAAAVAFGWVAALAAVLAGAGWAAHRGAGSPYRNGSLVGLCAGLFAWLIAVAPGVTSTALARATVGQSADADLEGNIFDIAVMVRGYFFAGFWATPLVGVLLGLLAATVVSTVWPRARVHAPIPRAVRGVWGLAVHLVGAVLTPLSEMIQIVLDNQGWTRGSPVTQEVVGVALVGLSVGGSALVVFGAVGATWSAVAEYTARPESSARRRGLLLGTLSIAILAVQAAGALLTGMSSAALAVVATAAFTALGIGWTWVSRSRPSSPSVPLRPRDLTLLTGGVTLFCTALTVLFGGGFLGGGFSLLEASGDDPLASATLLPGLYQAFWWLTAGTALAVWTGTTVLAGAWVGLRALWTRTLSAPMVLTVFAHLLVAGVLTAAASQLITPIALNSPEDAPDPSPDEGEWISIRRPGSGKLPLDGVEDGPVPPADIEWLLAPDLGTGIVIGPEHWGGSMVKQLGVLDPSIAEARQLREYIYLRGLELGETTMYVDPWEDGAERRWFRVRVDPNEGPSNLPVAIGGNATIDLQRRFTTVSVTDPTVATAHRVEAHPTQVRVEGLAPGKADLLLVPSEGDPRPVIYDLEVVRPE